MRIPKYLIVVFLFTLFFSLISHFHLHNIHADYWSRASVIQELANPSFPHSKVKFFSTIHPFGPVPYNYNPYLWALAMIKKISHQDVFLILNAMGVLNFVLFSIGLHLFLKEYFLDSELSFFMLPVMLFFWGKSWDFSGAYDLGALGLNLSSPYFFAYALGFFALAFFIKFLKTGRGRFLLLPAFFLPTILLNNLEPGVFTLGTMGLLTLVEKKLSLKIIFSLLGLAALTVLLASSWPYFSFLGLLRDGFALKQLFVAFYYFYPEHLLRLGPALLGIPLLFYYMFKKRYPLVVFGFFLFFLGYLLAFFLKIPTGWRLLFFITFFLHLSIALYLREKLIFLGQPFILSKKNMGVVVFSSVALACLLYQTVSMTTKQLGFRSFQEAFEVVQNNKVRGLGLEKQFRFLSEYVPLDAIILSDIDTSHIVSAFSGRPVFYLEWNTLYDPLLQGFKERREEIYNFFNKELSLDQRLKTINKYKAKYVLWNLDQVLKPFPDDLEKLGTVIYQKDSLTLLKIHSKYH